MELLNRYLQAVRKHLPWKRQDDIIAELRANLESQLEDREAELGRPMTASESESWIAQLGPPMQMASRYQPQRYLIGPAMFPAYVHILRLASVWTIAIYLLANVINATVVTPFNTATVAHAVLNLPFVLIQVVAWMTLAFAAIEFALARFPDMCPKIDGLEMNWTPRDLPPLETREYDGKKTRSYGYAMAEAAFGFVVLGWLLLLPQNPFLMFGPGAAFFENSPYELAPIWMTVYWWIVALNCVQLTSRCIKLLRGSWQRSGLMEHIVVKSMSLASLVILANAPGQIFVLLKRPDLAQAQNFDTLQQANHGIHSAALLLCVIVSAQLAWNIAQAIIAAARKRAAAR